jgi:hypothetical protein
MFIYAQHAHNEKPTFDLKALHNGIMDYLTLYWEVLLREDADSLYEKDLRRALHRPRRTSARHVQLFIFTFTLGFIWI